MDAPSYPKSALAYWRCTQTLRLALGLGLADEAAEVIEALREGSRRWHPAIRRRCAACLPAFEDAFASLLMEIARDVASV